MCVRTHSRVLLVVGLMVIPSYKDSGYESFYLTNLLHLNCKSVAQKNGSPETVVFAVHLGLSALAVASNANQGDEGTT